MKQTDKMRELVADYGMDEGKVCAAYARAEELGEVSRKRNKNRISADHYAVLLWKDGIRKGWLSK